MSKPRITYCVLTQNSGATLRDTLESIKKQTLSKEIIVVDTNSTDQTLEIAKDYGARIFNEPEGNLAKARNIGLVNGKGKYQAFVDSDAILFDKWDIRMSAFIREDNVAGAGANWLSVGKTSVELAQNDVASRHRGIIETSSIATMNAMYSRERIGETRFDESYSRASEDVDFNFQLRAKGYKLLFDAEKFIRHHNPTSLMGLMKKYYTYGKWFLKSYKKHPQERNRHYQFRVVYMIALLFNIIITVFYVPWGYWLGLQLLVPFFMYIYLMLDAYVAFVHASKFYAHLCGMLRSLMGD